MASNANKSFKISISMDRRSNSQYLKIGRANMVGAAVGWSISQRKGEEECKYNIFDHILQREAVNFLF